MRTLIKLQGSNFPTVKVDHAERPKLYERKITIAASASAVVPLLNNGKPKSVFIRRDSGTFTVTVASIGAAILVQQTPEGIVIPVASTDTSVTIQNQSASDKAQFTVMVY
mgnify:CR=1 FL=1